LVLALVRYSIAGDREKTLTIQWRKKQENYARRYSHDLLDFRRTLLNCFQLLRLKTMLEFCRGDVLDVGCADSRFTTMVSDKGCYAVGLDISLWYIHRAKKRSRSTDYVCGVGEYLPFKKKSFDTVVMGELIEHVPNVRKVLSEAIRVSRNAILITTPNALTNPTAILSADHIRAFTYSSLMRLLHDFDLMPQFIGQPISVPLPVRIMKVLYLFGKALYVDAKEMRRATPPIIFTIATVFSSLLIKFSSVFPTLSTTFVVKASPATRRLTLSKLDISDALAQSSQIIHRISFSGN